MNLGDIFNMIFRIVLLILEVLIIIWELQLLFGGSPTIEELLIGIVLLLGGFTFSHNREIGVMKNEMKHNFLNIKNSFDNIKEDMNQIKHNINLIINKLKV